MNEYDEEDFQNLVNDVRRAVMMARENRAAIADLKQRVEALEATIEEMRTLIGGVE